MDTVTPDTAQISLFGDEELPIVAATPPLIEVAPAPKKPRVRTAKLKPTPQQIAEREAIERAAVARMEKKRAQQAWEARKPVPRRVRHRWENAYD